MIKIEKRLMEYCENCDMLQPCTMKLKEKQYDYSYAIKVVVMCQHADICSHAVHQYQKSCENVPETENVKITGAALMQDGSMELEGILND